MGDQGTNKPAQMQVSMAMFRECARRGARNSQAILPTDSIIVDGSQIFIRAPNPKEREYAAEGCNFGISTGDNIYGNGPPLGNFAAKEGQVNPVFATHFEAHYEMFDFKFFMSMGNHDYGTRFGSEHFEHKDFNLVGRQEVEYGIFCSNRYHMGTGKVPKSTTNKPLLEHRFYSIPLLPDWVKITALDTNIWDARPEKTPQEYMDMQKDLVCKTTPKTKINIVYGHHPFYAHGSHGDEAELV